MFVAMVTVPLPASSFQLDLEAMLEQRDGLAERRLIDPDTSGRATEMQLFGEREEVMKLPEFERRQRNAHNDSLLPNPLAARGPAATC